MSSLCWRSCRVPTKLRTNDRKQKLWRQEPLEHDLPETKVYFWTPFWSFKVTLSLIYFLLDSEKCIIWPMSTFLKPPAHSIFQESLITSFRCPVFLFFSPPESVPASNRVYLIRPFGSSSTRYPVAQVRRGIKLRLCWCFLLSPKFPGRLLNLCLIPTIR